MIDYKLHLSHVSVCFPLILYMCQCMGTHWAAVKKKKSKSSNSLMGGGEQVSNGDAQWSHFMFPSLPYSTSPGTWEAVVSVHQMLGGQRIALITPVTNK